jgi:hypothetical protein
MAEGSPTNTADREVLVVDALDAVVELSACDDIEEAIEMVELVCSGMVSNFVFERFFLLFVAVFGTFSLRDESIETALTSGE